VLRAVSERPEGDVAAALATLTRAEVETTVLDGFFPLVPMEARPRRRADAGGGEWGLPFAAEQEITSASAQARRELKSFAAQIAIDLAKARIASGIEANSDEQLVREFASRLGKEGNA